MFYNGPVCSRQCLWSKQQAPDGSQCGKKNTWNRRLCRRSHEQCFYLFCGRPCCKVEELYFFIFQIKVITLLNLGFFRSQSSHRSSSFQWGKDTEKYFQTWRCPVVFSLGLNTYRASFRSSQRAQDISEYLKDFCFFVFVCLLLFVLRSSKFIILYSGRYELCSWWFYTYTHAYAFSCMWTVQTNHWPTHANVAP